jgi:hypothetical protein
MDLFVLPEEYNLASLRQYLDAREIDYEEADTIAMLKADANAWFQEQVAAAVQEVRPVEEARANAVAEMKELEMAHEEVLAQREQDQVRVHELQAGRAEEAARVRYLDE